MKHLLFSATAQDDLLQIASFIALDRPVRARSFVKELRKQCQLLIKFPNMGVARPDIADGLRMLVHGRYLIFFSCSEDNVLIERLLHSARDVMKLLSHSTKPKST